MTQNKDSKTNYHEEDLGKEMEQISEENDEEKLNQSHDSDVRSDLDQD